MDIRFICLGVHYDIDSISDLSPYYLVKKDNLKLLVNIKDWVLEVIELPSNTNVKKFYCGNICSSIVVDLNLNKS